jgi:hypothetical protein
VAPRRAPRTRAAGGDGQPAGRQAWEHLREIGELDAPELARRLLADNRQSGATAANVVAVAAVEFCRSYGVHV